MNNNPWNNADAFQPMFTESVTIRNISVKACVFPIEDVEPFSDADISNSNKQYSVLVFKDDWNSDRPKIGDDVFSAENNLEAKIVDVDDCQVWFDITARSVK